MSTIRNGLKRNRGRNPRKEPIKFDGWTFANNAELKRYFQLRDMERNGDISFIECQVKVPLMDTAREPSTIGKRGGVKPGKVIMLGCAYIADFSYHDRDDNIVLEDVKGFKEEDYKIKRKWVYDKYKVVVREIDPITDAEFRRKYPQYYEIYKEHKR